jgi:hypothetical protein
MAGENNDTTIRIGLDADLSGGVQTEKQLDSLKHKAAQLGKEGSSSVGKVTGAIGGLQKACGLLRNVLTGFGVVGVFAALAAAVGKVKDSFGEAKKQADEFDRAKAKAAHREAVENLAESYEKLCKATQRAAEAARHANEMHDIAMKNARELEDAQMDLAEQSELAAVDAADPAASEKRALISARYAAKRGGLGAARAREDVTTEINRMSAEATAKRKAAKDEDASAEDTERLIASTRERRRLAYNRSIELNEEDRTGAWESGGGMVKDFVTLNWGKLGRMKTEKGDSIRKEAASETKELDAEIKRLQKKAKKKREKAEQLRREAKTLDERGKLAYDSLDAISVRERVADVTGTRGNADADNALDKKNKEIAKKAAQQAKDAATVQEGPGRIAAIQRQIDAAEAQRRAAQESDAREQEEAVMARLALENFNNGEGRRGGTGTRARRSELEADVERETREAASSRIQLQGTLATLATTLKGLNSDLAKVKREVDAAVKRQNNINAEAPEG